MMTPDTIDPMSGPMQVAAPRPMNPFRAVPPITVPGQNPAGPPGANLRMPTLPSPPQAPASSASPFPTTPQGPGAGQPLMGAGGAMGDTMRNAIMQSMLYGNPYGAAGGTTPASLIGQVMKQVAGSTQIPGQPAQPNPAQAAQPAAAQPAPAVPTVAQAVANDTRPDSTDYHALASQYATQYGVPTDLFTRQINQESGFNPKARSPAGAIGIAQYMPETAKSQGFDPTDPTASLQNAAKYMAELYQKYGNWTDALIAYNAGGGTADRYAAGDTSALPDETVRYIQDILGTYN